MDIFERIETEFVRAHSAGECDARLAMLRASWPNVTALASVDALLVTCRDQTGRALSDGDAALAVLCIEATRNNDEMSSLLLIWLFLPGLRTCAREIFRLGVLEDSDIAGELLAGFFEAAHKVTTDSIYIATHLIRGARRRALGRLNDQQSFARTHLPLPEGYDAASPEDANVSDAQASPELRRVRALSSQDAALLLADRDQLARMAASQGCTVEALWMRRARIRQRERQAIARAASERNPNVLVKRPVKNLSKNDH